MSHFTVMVIGEDCEKQLEPFNENASQEYLEFVDQTEQFKKEYENETCVEFFCGSRSSWGQEVSKNVFDTISKLSIGESATLSVSALPMVYFELGNRYRCYDAESNAFHQPPENHVWIRVTKIVSSSHPDERVCFEGTIVVIRINPPKDIKFSEKYSTFEEFVKDWHGLDEVDCATKTYGYWHNPNAKWDWYQLGGRWTGFFKMKTGTDGLVGVQGLMTEPAEEGYADSAHKCEIDFDGMRCKAGEIAGVEWDTVRGAVGDAIKTFIPWKKVLEAHPDTNEARRIYNDQEAVRLLGKNVKDGIWYNLEDYLDTRDEHVEAAKQAALSTYAILFDGKWYARGEMGWWGISNDKKDKTEWNTEVTKLIESLPDDTRLSVYDCHI